MDNRTLAKDVTHIAILLGLIVALVFLLTWTGVIRCRAIPGWCDAYWSIVEGGKPRILILAGNDGMGDPDLLKQALANPNYAGVFATLEDIDAVSLGNIQQYNLVIVEKSRKMSSAKLKMFIDYVNNGGRLVWTGDAGVESLDQNESEFLYEDEDPNLDTNIHQLIGPWARKDGKTVVPFNEFLGVQYETNFCSVKTCERTPWQGMLRPNSDHPLVYALRPNLVLRGDFAIVKETPGSISTRVLSLDWLSNLIGKDGKDYGKLFPLIVTSGYGERVAYYAVPPEQFVADDLPEKYYSILENMYYGMLR